MTNYPAKGNATNAATSYSIVPILLLLIGFFIDSSRIAVFFTYMFCLAVVTNGIGIFFSIKSIKKKETHSRGYVLLVIGLILLLVSVSAILGNLAGSMAAQGALFY